MLRRLYFIVECVWWLVSRALSALCVYSKFEHHLHPPGYICAKFRFFRGLHCWASPWRRNRVHNHSPSLFDAWGTEALALQNTVYGGTKRIRPVLIESLPHRCTPCISFDCTEETRVLLWNCCINSRAVCPMMQVYQQSVAKKCRLAHCALKTGARAKWIQRLRPTAASCTVALEQRVCAAYRWSRLQTSEIDLAPFQPSIHFRITHDAKHMTHTRTEGCKLRWLADSRGKCALETQKAKHKLEIDKSTVQRHARPSFRCLSQRRMCSTLFSCRLTAWLRRTSGVCMYAYCWK